MATYIANHMIRHNGRLYQKGDEITTLSPAEAQELLKHRAVTQFGKAARELQPSPEPAAKAAKRTSKASAKTSGADTAEPAYPAEPGGG